MFRIFVSLATFKLISSISSISSVSAPPFTLCIGMVILSVLDLGWSDVIFVHTVNRVGRSNRPIRFAFADNTAFVDARGFATSW